MACDLKLEISKRNEAVQVENFSWRKLQEYGEKYGELQEYGEKIGKAGNTNTIKMQIHGKKTMYNLEERSHEWQEKTGEEDSVSPKKKNKVVLCYSESQQDQE